ncbi:ARM repeat-containing protein [Lentinula edodes]|uniref:ARM repeat-containing protein n=1 Tax=Lentinula edodes TaxID=5353 RepID=A0A1Q3EDT4_LENED|nr:ARM repeat-containing protein [Lentinula edodes]
MAMLPPVESMVALGSVMSSTNSVPHIRRTCGYLMSRQLLRPEGVKGLCAAVFGDSENADDIQLDKLQHISRVLITVPAVSLGLLFNHTTPPN